MGSQFIITHHAVDRYCERVRDISPRVAQSILSEHVHASAPLKEKTYKGEFLRVSPDIDTVFICKKDDPAWVVVTVLSQSEKDDHDRRRAEELAEYGQLLGPLPPTPKNGATSGLHAHLATMEDHLRRYKEKCAKLNSEVQRLTMELAAFRREERKQLRAQNQKASE